MFFSNGTPSFPITNQQDKGDCEHNPYSTKVEDPFSLHMPETSEGTAAAEVHVIPLRFQCVEVHQVP